MKRVLLVEDDPVSARLIQALLRRPELAPCEVETVDRLAYALPRLIAVHFDAVLLDLSLPDSQGLDTLQQMLATAPYLPMVVLTNLDDPVLGSQAVAAGAQDYLVKSRLDGWQLERAVRHAGERQRLRSELQAQIVSAQEAELVIREQNQILQVQREELTSQSEELQAQNEELMAQNQELAAQGEALLASEARLRSILTSIPIGMHFYRREADGQLTFTSANPAADRILGIKHADLVDRSIIEAFPSLAGTDVPARYAAVAAGAEPWQSEELTYQDGRIAGAFDVLAFQFASGEMVAAFQDITRRKQDEAALRQQNAYLAALQDTMLELASQLDLDVLLENIVRRAMELTRTTGGSLDLLDEATHHLLPRVGLGTLANSLNVEAQPGEGLTGLIWQTGEPLVVNDYATWERRITRGHFEGALAGVPLGAAGAVLGVLSVGCAAETGRVFGAETVELLNQFARLATLAIHNAQLFAAARDELAERRLAEAALRESETRFRALFEQAAVGVAMVDSTTSRFVEVNRRYSEITGYSPEALTTLTVQSFTDPEDMAVQDKLMAQLAAGEVREFSLEKRYRHADGHTIWVNVTVSPLWQPGEPPRYHIAVVQDVTQRKAVEAALAEERANLVKRVDERTAELSLANEALARAARTKDEFLASMSHELRTPLTGILGVAEALQLDVYGPLAEKQRKPVASLHASGLHLLDLINDILDLAKVEAGKMNLELAPVTVVEVCQASLQMVQQTAQKKNQRLSLERDLKVTTLTADGRRLKQMLVNLLSNAVKFTPEGGAVGLKVEGDAAEQLVRFTVWDTGIGIAPESLGQLFKPFVQLDSRLAREYPGTGLGLSLVLRMAELHGGSVAVQSTPGQGSRFTVTLPWRPVALVDRASSAHHLREALVVEDTVVAADQLSRYLNELGIANTVHSSGRGVIERVVATQPEVILLDILLPEVSGWEVLKQLKADPRTRNIPVVVVTVVDDEARARELGAAGYLRKPAALSDLQTALDRVASQAAQQAIRAAINLTTPSAPLVLVTDDNTIIVGTVTDYLQARGYRVMAARNGAEALERAHTVRPDLILMDIQMPEMDGLEATRQLRADPDAALAHTPIVALTALAMAGDREQCLAAGMDEYLAKPVNLPELGRTIERLLGARPKAA